MPKLRIDKRIQSHLKIGLTNYASELEAMISPIKSEARYAGVPGQAYVPENLAEEYELAQGTRRVISSFSNEDSLFGKNVQPGHLQIMASALALRRDDLSSHLEVVENEPLNPQQAASPLRDEIERIDNSLCNFWNQFGYSDFLAVIKQRRELRSGLSYPRPVEIGAIIEDGEGQTVEFKEKYPDQAHDLAKEIAAFGTSNPGVILLGVDDNGARVGLRHMTRPEDRDNLKTRIEGLSSSRVTPSLQVRVRFDEKPRRIVAIIEVPKGPEPIYYSNGTPYVRHGTLSRPAQSLVLSINKQR